MLNRYKQFRFGFTLIELMVAISIFAVVAVIATGAVLTANNVNKKAQAIKQVMDNLSFALDSMTLKLKSGGGYYCIHGADSLPATPITYPTEGDGTGNCTNSPGNGIAFKSADADPGNANNRSVYFYRFNGTALEVAKGTEPIAGGSLSMQPFVPLTASEIGISSVQFYVVGNGATDAQPRVLISIYGTATVGHETSDFAVETTVSDRR